MVLMPVETPARMRFSVWPQSMGPCSRSMITKSKPASPKSSTSTGEGISRKVPTTNCWEVNFFLSEFPRKRVAPDSVMH